jgi:peptide/nickel transport system ATP-binding protein
MMALRVQAEHEVHPAVPRRDTAALIQVQDLRKVFRNGNRTVDALGGVSMQVGPNESVGIVGESGSGKTTLARILVGLESATSGDVKIDGISASHWENLSAKDGKHLRGTVQIVFQDPYSSLNPMRSVGWTLSEAVSTHQPVAKGLDTKVRELLESVGLQASYAQRKPVALSGGERQRVAIARALAASPRILICDEPVSALDMSVQAQILNLFASLRAERGIGYLFITHDLSIVRQISEYLYVMHRGLVVEPGVTGHVLDNPQDAYTIKLLESVPRSESGWLTPSGQV